MASGFMVSFNINGDYGVNMFVVEDMKFCEVVEHFSKYYSLKKEDEATFFLILKK